MSTIERKEKVNITYDGSKIKLRGLTFDVELPINVSGLTSIYMSGKGEGVVTLSVDVPDIKDGAEVQPSTPSRKRRKSVKTLEEVKADEVKHKYDTHG